MTPQAKSVEGVMEAHARVSRAKQSAIRKLHQITAEFHAEFTDAENHLRAIAREIEGVA